MDGRGFMSFRERPRLWFLGVVAVSFSMVFLINRAAAPVSPVVSQTRKELLFWSAAVETRPDFRDAYIKLAVLHWQLGRDFDARKFLEEALKIDPNNETARKLQETIFK